MITGHLATATRVDVGGNVNMQSHGVNRICAMIRYRALGFFWGVFQFTGDLSNSVRVKVIKNDIGSDCVYRMTNKRFSTKYWGN